MRHAQKLANGMTFRSSGITFRPDGTTFRVSNRSSVGSGRTIRLFRCRCWVMGGGALALPVGVVHVGCATNPLQWFGILTPMSLKQGQLNFVNGE